MKRAILAAMLAAGLQAAPALAQQDVDIRFPAGSSGTVINGTIVGNEYVDYNLRAAAGQQMQVDLAVTGTNGNGSVFFNILPGGADYPALFNGSMDGQSARVTLPSDGVWTIRTYLMGNDADAGKTVGYSIAVEIY